MTDTIIQVTGLGRDYPMGEHTVHALRDASFKLDRGEFVAIMGPSGSGKSTCMHLLGCLDTPSSGTYVLDGVDVSGLTRDALAEIRNRKIGFVFQSFNLLSRASARKNVELPLMYGGTAASDRVARAMVNDPVLLLADEPTGALDSQTSIEIMALFQTLNDSGITVVVVTHEQEVAHFAKRILSFRDGQLMEDTKVTDRADARAMLVNTGTPS